MQRNEEATIILMHAGRSTRQPTSSISGQKLEQVGFVRVDSDAPTSLEAMNSDIEVKIRQKQDELKRNLFN